MYVGTNKLTFGTQTVITANVCGISNEFNCRTVNKGKISVMRVMKK